MTDQSTVWVFNGPRRYPGFPSGVFSDLESAEKWIQDNKATGTLTEYPVNIGVYDWAVKEGFFKPKKQEHYQPSFIESFSSASQAHYHYEDGERVAG